MKKWKEGRRRKEGSEEGGREWRRKEISLNYSIHNTKIHLNFIRIDLDTSQTGLMLSQFTHVVAYMNTLFFSMAK